MSTSYLTYINILTCTKGKEQKKKGYNKNKAEINWNTEYKSEADKYTIKMIAKITSG